MDVTILITVFLLGLITGVPVAISLGVASLAYLFFADIPFVVMPQ